MSLLVPSMSRLKARSQRYLTFSSGKRETLWETRELQLFAITAKSKDTGEGIAKSLSTGHALCQLTSLFQAFLIPCDGALRTYRVFFPLNHFGETGLHILPILFCPGPVRDEH